jgi:eukaryotic-like serine/threonine-protein kinase
VKKKAPAIRAAIAINQGNPGKAIELLQATTPYEFGFATGTQSNYLRGLAYLKLHQGKEAATEFQKILDHPGVCIFSLPTCRLARLQLGRARAEAGDAGGARTAYQDFFTLWKDADPDVPILKEAKAEYAKLQ